MKTVFKMFNRSYYETVCDFLIELSKDDRKHINWNWARWEWMFFHPEFENSLVGKIGLWFDSDELVGMTTYDHYYGEAFFAVKKGYEELEKEILEYAINNFSNENGLGIAVNDSDNHTIDLLHSYGFRKDTNSENILEKPLEFNNFDYTLPKGIKIKSINIKEDLYKRHKVLWEGFENDGDVPSDEQTIIQQKRMLSAPHLNPNLHTVAKNEDGEYVAYCGCWYSPNTDYAYVEPVCTIPQYRGEKIGKALLLESLRRCYSEGAKKAYVISDAPFYKSIGFEQHSHYKFYWHD
ncbi:GNAT family N-acetyltransferase [Aquibacillus koreensis]|uniref:GNAT family N-acetyltransferase n=1 Tax=Aquibacillus koreensis TaxID=279446 RepID=UPI0021A693FB|nr:GNAT family N-acetyltransferase [Aquibacillus koreensis]MCT2536255.1 GNAT family N-acetyltransferase [Aquibacillus koreensis]